MAALCTAVFAAGMLGYTEAAPAGAASRSQTIPTPAPGSGVTIVVLEDAQPVGPLSFT
jgi:hypothetical protein